jgi:hypothetical protein
MIITSVAVTAKGMRVPNRRHRAIAEGFREYQSAANIAHANNVYAKLVSRMHEAGQIEKHWKARAQTLQAEHRRRVDSELSQGETDKRDTMPLQDGQRRLHAA